MYAIMSKIQKKFTCIINTLLIPDAREGGRDRVANTVVAIQTIMEHFVKRKCHLRVLWM